MVVDWLSRSDRALRPSPSLRVRDDAITAVSVEGASPGVAALFEGVQEDGTHAVLDLGPASDSSFRLYSRFARRVRFADLFREDGACRGWIALGGAVPSQPEQPYDLLLVWDVLDRLAAEQRTHMVQWLAEVSAPGARIHAVVNASGNPTTQPVRYSLLEVDRMLREPTGPARPARRRLLPAEVERLLAPFQVRHAYTLRGGLREYLAVLPGPPGQDDNRTKEE